MKRESENGRVLLVEDDAALASMVADFLSPHGFEVAIEGRGDTAVDRIIDENPDAVILDVNLPGLDGFAVCKAVRSGYRGVIIILTARGEEIDEVLGLSVASPPPSRWPTPSTTWPVALRHWSARNANCSRPCRTSCGRPCLASGLLST